LLSSFPAAPQDAGQWYLISEAELQSIDAYKKTCEAEKQSWLSQVSELKTQAAKLSERAANSRQESENLNLLLRQERETNKKLSLFYNEYEAGVSLTISQQNIRIEELKVENNALAGQRNTLVAIVIGAAALVSIFAVFKVLRLLKVLPF
jgi:hypothetical protein